VQWYFRDSCGAHGHDKCFAQNENLLAVVEIILQNYKKKPRCFKKVTLGSASRYARVNVALDRSEKDWELAVAQGPAWSRDNSESIVVIVHSRRKNSPCKENHVNNSVVKHASVKWSKGYSANETRIRGHVMITHSSMFPSTVSSRWTDSRLRAGRPGFDSRQGRIFPFATKSRPALGPTQPPFQWEPGSFLG
jgi:hypothetical protein